jgi:hypothetical protein
VLTTNPFEPKVEVVPLRLLLDAASFDRLTGDARAAAEYLAELCRTDAVDGLWGWQGQPLLPDLPQTELGPVERDARVVRIIGEPVANFIGGVQCWSQFERFAVEQGYDAAETARFVYYASLNHFNRSSGRHYLITADQRLLKESEAETGWFRRGREGTRIRSVEQALFFCGLVMKAQGRVVYEAPKPGYTVYTSARNIYDFLSRDLLEPRARLLSAVREEGLGDRAFYRSDNEALVEGVFDRVIDILHARDRVALANGRVHDAEALDGVRYDLRSMISAASGAIDAIAVLTDASFGMNFQPGSRVSLRDRDFRRAAKGKGAIGVAAAASALMPFLNFLWSLRNPILHRQGLPGYTLHQIGSADMAQITLTRDQLQKLDACCSKRKESGEQWGLRRRDVAGIDPSVDPWPFAERLSAASLGAIRRLASSLVEDAAVDEFSIDWSASERRAIRCFRWLSGFPLEGR